MYTKNFYLVDIGANGHFHCIVIFFLLADILFMAKFGILEYVSYLSRVRLVML